MNTQSPGSNTHGATAGHRAILEALEILASAAALLSDRDATEAAENTRRLLEHDGRGSFATVALSPREREVASHMATGSTNRQIADTLSISIATVERHASNIFTKLGVHSRSQVAVWAFARGLMAAPSS